MKIISLDINNFGNFSERHFDFSSSLNFFVHENGWGKSTLAAFIKAMFYGLDYNRKNDFNDRKHYFPWNKNSESLFGGSMDFEFKNKKYKIVRFFGLKKSQDIFEIYNLETNQPLKDFKQEPGIKFFGLDKESFERSAFINSDKKNFPKKTDSINSKLNNLIQDTNESVNFQNAQEKLEDAIKKYSSSRANFAIIPNLKNQILNVNEKLFVLEDNEKKFIQNQKILEEQKNQCEKINSLLSKLDEQKIILAQNSLSKEENLQLENLNLKFKNKNCSPEKFSDLEKKLNELEDLKNQIDYSENKFKFSVKSKTQKILSLSFTFLSLVSFLSFIFSFLFFKIQSKNFQILKFTEIAFGILFFISAAFFFAKNQFKSPVKNQFKNQKENLLKKYFTLENELSNFINSFENEKSGETEKIKSKSKNLGFELNSIFNDYKNFTNLNLKKNKISELEKKYKINFEQIFEQIKILEEKKNLLKKNINILENENDELKNSAEEKIILENQKINLQNELKLAQKKFWVLETTKKFLEDANENLNSNYFQKMNLAFKKYFSKIVEPSVAQKILFNSDLKVNIESDGLLYDENFLSTGFSELVDFCTKLALVDCMFENEKPSLILDEPFSNLDERKTQKALSLLKKLSTEYQIIYFSCHKINRSLSLSK